jgi:hypothetical protein
MVNVVIGEEVIIDPAEPASIPLYRRASLKTSSQMSSFIMMST